MLDEFYVICMKNCKDKTIYVMENVGNNIKWTFDINEAIWFETQDSAEKFARGYFKNFDKWYIGEVYC